SGSRPASLPRRATVRAKWRLISSATSSGSLSSRMSDVPEVAAAALAGGEAGGAFLRFGVERRHAKARLVGKRTVQLEVPLLVGRAAIRAHADLQEPNDHLGQRL